jgi:hypothetical protein
MNILSGSISRVLQHLNNSEFGVISAYLTDLDDKENKSRHSQLKSDIRALKLGFIELKSYWEENGFKSSEQSLFVPNIAKKQVLELGSKYSQFSVLHSDGKDNPYRVEHLCTRSDCGNLGNTVEEFRGQRISEKEFVGAFSALKKGGRASTSRNFKLVGMEELTRPVGLPIGSEAKIISAYQFTI